MKWAVLLGSPDISGGTYVIFEHAIRARRAGIDVSIITDEPVDRSRLFWHPEANELNWLTIDEASKLFFDIAIATWWRTVYELYRVQARSYAYFVQSIESRFYPEEAEVLRKLVDATYMLPLRVITEAKWIRKYLSEGYGLSPALVPNGIRKDLYCAAGERHGERVPGKLRVLVEGAIDVPFKNVQKTLEICKKSNADEIWLLTLSPIDRYPGIDRVFSKVPIQETASVYRSCDVLVKLSYVEGMFGPPLEMFHCGGTTITYDVTGHDEYIVHGHNGLVAGKDDDDQVLGYINQLKDDTSLLNRLKEGATETAAKWPDWAASASAFRDAVGHIAASESISRELLERRSRFYFDFYYLAEKNRLKYLQNPIVVLANRFYEILHEQFKGRFK